MVPELPSAAAPVLLKVTLPDTPAELSAVCMPKSRYYGRSVSLMSQTAPGALASMGANPPTQAARMTVAARNEVQMSAALKWHHPR